MCGLEVVLKFINYEVLVMIWNS